MLLQRGRRAQGQEAGAGLSQESRGQREYGRGGVPEKAYDRMNDTKEDVIEDAVSEKPAPTPRKSHRWTFKEEKDLVGYYQAGMSTDQLARLFGKDEDSVKEKLAQKGIAIG